MKFLNLLLEYILYIYYLLKFNKNLPKVKFLINFKTKVYTKV